MSEDPDDGGTLLAGLRGADGKCHGQAAADEHGRVERSEDDVELEAGFGPRRGIPDAIEHVGEKQPAEEQHFGDEEQPHPERRRFVLLLQRVEMMLEIAVMGGVRAVRAGVRGIASDNFDLPLRILVRVLGHHGLRLEVVRQRRRLRRPFETGRVPRVIARVLTPED